MEIVTNPRRNNMSASLKCRPCRRHSSEQDAAASQGKPQSCCASSSSRQCHGARGKDVLVFIALALAAFASGVASNAVPIGAANTAAATTATASADAIPGEEAPFHKEFPASRVRAMLKELFQKRRAEMLEGMFQTAAASRAGVRGVRKRRKRRRRDCCPTTRRTAWGPSLVR